MLDWPEQSQTSPTRMSLTVSAGPLAPRTVHLQGRPAGLDRVEGDAPLAVLAGHDFLFLAVEENRDGLALGGPAPHRDRLVLLDDHVVADDGGQADLGREAGRQRGDDDPREGERRISLHR